MIFSTIQFFIFYAIVLPVALALKNTRFFHLFLLLASCYFYMSWNAYYLWLLLFTISVDFSIACRMTTAKSKKERRRWLLVSLVSNLGLLGVFKYTNFVVDTFNEILPEQAQLANLDIVLPVGISFYTFQSLSYTIDVYHGRLPAERSFTKFALFVSFFPQLVAGPIVRAQEFIPQLYQRIVVDWQRLKEGGERFLIGLVKKLLIADALAPYVDRIYSNPAQYDAATLWYASFAFGIQIYCDFSGYSDMAIGTAKCLGFDFPENFNMPYFARNIREFWHRWHITLSTWLRDYLYIPLGGSRGGALLSLKNVMITMLLGGLWHGASWKFVIWGGLHGLYLVVHRVWSTAWEKTAWCAPSGWQWVFAPLSTCFTFLCVTLAWVYFRASDAATATTMIGRMISFDGGGEFVASPLLLITAVVLLSAHLLATFTDYAALYRKLPVPFKLVSYGVVFYLLSISSIHENTPFIYFQF
jgi:alginate O-acetyltransferase complex protein AlgI